MVLGYETYLKLPVMIVITRQVFEGVFCREREGGREREGEQKEERHTSPRS
jgi:hypothetical protein